MDAHELGRQDFISITTFRRDGTPVATPMWVVGSAGHLYLWTGSQTGKVKRIRNNPAVRVAACSRMGDVHGEWFDGQAAITEGAEEALGYELLDQKYNLLKFIGAASAPVPGRVILRVRIDKE